MDDRAHTVENYKDQNEVTSMKWPAQSPNLNIIENIWLYMKRELQKSEVDIATKNDLLREIQGVWWNIELDFIRNLYHSIPDRLDNVIKMKGLATRFMLSSLEPIKCTPFSRELVPKFGILFLIRSKYLNVRPFVKE